MRLSTFADDEQIAAFVDGIKFGETRVIGHFSANLDVVAAVQVSIGHGNVVELAFSVEEPYRRRGIGRALMERALLWARNRGIARAYVHCLSHNIAMRRLARDAGMALTMESGETMAVIDLTPATLLSLFRESHAEGSGVLEFSMKALRQTMAGPNALQPATA